MPTRRPSTRRTEDSIIRKTQNAPNAANFTPTSPAGLRKTVAIVAYDDAQLLDVCGPLQVFSSANDLSLEQGNPAPYDCIIVSREPTVSTTAGVVLSSTPFSALTVLIDTLMVVGGAGLDAAAKDRSFMSWISEQSKIARRTVSVCNGAFILAEAGLLDGRRAATHWQFFNEFSRRFPGVTVDTQSIYVEDGAVWTSGGVTAGMDLSLALIERDIGRPLALAVAQHLVMFLKRPGGQSQFSAFLAMQDGAEFDDLHAWMGANISGSLTVDTLAEQAGMSGRTFVRRYKQVTGRTPREAVEGMRVDAARRLLEQGHSLNVAIRRCGFGSNENMRRAFVRVLEVSPNDYVERFGMRAKAGG